MQLKPLLMLSIVSSLGCGGLKPTLCISDPKQNQLECYDYQKAETSTKSFAEVDNWLCENASDFQNVVEACKAHRAGPKVNECVVFSAEGQMHCFDETTQKFNLIEFADTENFVCVSAREKQNLLDYCKTIKK